MGDALEILLYGHPSLRRKCRPVEVFDDDLRALASRMEVAMYAERGIGLAAPQVGRDLRLLLAEDAREGAPRARVFVNPEIVWSSSERDKYAEGCLSLPDVFEDVVRPVRVRMRYQDLEGREQEIEDDGLLARVLQHELDHLEGVLFVDHLSALKRKLLARKLRALSERARQQPGA